MKKILLVSISVLFIIGIFGFLYSNYNKEENEEKYTEKDTKKLMEINELKETLLTKFKNYSKDIITEEFIKNSIPNQQYTITLRDMAEEYMYDISMFKNQNGKECKLDETKIEFEVNEELELEYQRYYLICGFLN